MANVNIRRKVEKVDYMKMTYLAGHTTLADRRDR